MKVFMNNKVYVSQKDVSLIFQLGIRPPQEVYETLAVLAGNNPIFEFYKSKENEFIEFSDEETKEFFRRQDYIINYGSFKKASIEDLDYLLENAIYDKQDILDSARHLINDEDLTRIKNNLLKINNRITGIQDITKMKLNVSDIVLPKREYVDKNEKHKAFLHQMMKPVF